MLGGEDGRTLFVAANHYSGTGASDGIVLTQPVDITPGGPDARPPSTGDRVPHPQSSRSRAYATGNAGSVARDIADGAVAARR
jgi:hypothetical protein